MRKIETSMIAAIRSRSQFKKDNTQVLQEDNGYGEVRLFGNIICRFNYNRGIISFDDCGYQTATTKSRLNAIIHAFTKPGQGIYQKDFKWFWNNGEEWDGGGMARFLV